MNIGEAVRERILELCRERDISINRLSSMSGVTQSTVNNIVSGRNRSTTISTIKKLCDGLGITIEEFFHSDLFRELEQEIQKKTPPVLTGQRVFFHWYTGSDELIEQAVPGAVPHQQTMFPPGEPQLEVPFGVLPPDPQASAREQGRKGDVFSLGHGVVGGDIPFVLHRFGVQTLVFLRLPGLLGFQSASTALDTCRRGGKDQIPAHRTDRHGRRDTPASGTQQTRHAAGKGEQYGHWISCV